jgi:hypothetical protein
MSSNYNASLRPAIVMVKDGSAHLIRRRETYDDLMRCDIWERTEPQEGEGHGDGSS